MPPQSRSFAASEQSGPDAPWHQRERLGMVPAKKQDVIFAEPALERCKAFPVCACLDFSHERSLVGPERIDVDVMTRAAKAGCSAEGIAFGFDSEFVVKVHEFTLDSVALSAMTGAAHSSIRSRAAPTGDDGSP